MELDERLNGMFKGVAWDGRDEVKQLIRDVLDHCEPESPFKGETPPGWWVAHESYQLKRRELGL